MATKRPTTESGKPEIPMARSFFDVETLMKMQQRNVETMVEANRIFVDTAQAIARCQSDMMRDCVEQMTRAFAELTSRGEPSEIGTKEGAAVQALFEKTAGHVRDIAELLSKSNAEAIQLVNGRMQSLVDEAAGSSTGSRQHAAAE
ncbi:MAG TPA: phasin family protein [Alphaproteobacteria bacterium]|nr:phasin family protein [Alphaproteobacteria bacterium]